MGHVWKIQWKDAENQNEIESQWQPVLWVMLMVAQALSTLPSTQPFEGSAKHGGAG